MKDIKFPICTISKILRILNSESETSWVAIPGVYILNSASKVSSTDQIEEDLTSGIAIKIFLNKKTGEIRTYIAKMLDTPEREIL